MPVSRKTAVANVTGLRVPQARVLRALVPPPEYADHPELRDTEWPCLPRARLGVRAGYTAISGTVTRALNGIREGSSSGDPHPGLLARGLVEVVRLDVEGEVEDCYRATPAGVAAYRAHVAEHGEELPPVRDAVSSTNKNRGYKVGENQQGAPRRY